MRSIFLAMTAITIAIISVDVAAAQPGTSFKTLFSREPALGNMPQRYPYQAWQMYYYRRPYNYHHINGHLQESVVSNSRVSVSPSNPYSNEVFRQIHENIVFDSSELRTRESMFEDGYLEYVDWKSHRDRRLEWANFGPRPKGFSPLTPLESSSRTVEADRPSFEESVAAPPVPLEPMEATDSTSAVPVKSLPVQEKSHYAQPLRVTTPADLWTDRQGASSGQGSSGQGSIGRDFSNGQLEIQSTDDR